MRLDISGAIWRKSIVHASDTPRLPARNIKREFLENSIEEKIQLQGGGRGDEVGSVVSISRASREDCWGYETEGDVSTSSVWEETAFDAPQIGF